MSLTEVYVDESGTGDSDPAYCLAGYIVKPNLGPAMATKWQKTLDRYGIEFFHMTDCAAYQHCEPYKSLGRDKCIQLATELIKLIKKYCLYGFSICFSPRFYSVYDDKDIKTRDPYPFSVAAILSDVDQKLKNLNYKGEVAYVFEAGHKHQGRAKIVLDRIVREGTTTQLPTTFSFQKKCDAILLQAADILAWHCQTHIKRKMKGQSMRADFRSLTEIPHTIYHLFNPFKDGVKETDTTGIAIDINPNATGTGFDEFIDAVYVRDKPIPAQN